MNKVLPEAIQVGKERVKQDREKVAAERGVISGKASRVSELPPDPAVNYRLNFAFDRTPPPQNQGGWGCHTPTPRSPCLRANPGGYKNAELLALSPGKEGPRSP